MIPIRLPSAYYRPSPFAFSSPGSGGALPRAQKIELAEFLIEPHRLVAHPLFLIVVAHLDEAGHREILAQRMAVEAVVGQDAPQVRMAVEQHAEQVVDLALVPVGGGIDGGRAERPASSSSVATLTRMRRFSFGDSS